MSESDGRVPAARPTPAQLEWQDCELGMFYHFDIPIYTPGWDWRSWRDLPAPDLYCPDALDTDQWLEAAVALGARVIERHFTLDRTWKGTDHAASLEPPGLEKLVRDIRAVESALGTANKQVLECEQSARAKLRPDAHTLAVQAVS